VHERTTSSLPAPLTRALEYVLREVQREAVWLVPSRVFIGIGWLRASAEKLSNPAWWDGAALRAFMDAHANLAVFPVFAQLMRGAFSDLAVPLGVTVMLLEVVIGVFLILGWWMRSAILVGGFLNVLFVMAGVPNPSAFYLVIQMALWTMGADRAFAFRPRRGRTRQSRADLSFSLNLVSSALWLALAGSSLGRIRDFSPAGSIHDPAAVLTVVACVGFGYAAIALLRALQTPHPRA
jgi:hypothetical protein